MQSFIVNIPEEKVSFFEELMLQLDLEIIAIDEQDANLHHPEEKTKNTPPIGDDSFLDWEAEKKNAKRK